MTTSSRTVFAALGFLCLFGAVHARAEWAFRLFRSEPQVITVTDFTEEGKKWPKASPGSPVYFEAMCFGAKNFQGLHGDPSPNRRAILNMILKALKEQGYEPATVPGQATVFLSISWGYTRANFGNLGFIGGDKMDLMWELHAGRPEYAANLFRRSMRSAEADMMMEMANNDLYIASIRAFDLKKVDEGTEVELWHTRIACESTGTMMRTALPTMITAAAPYIGRETDKPVIRDPLDFKKGNVEIGPTTVVGEVEASEHSK